jgi:hypothetical protein
VLVVKGDEFGDSILGDGRDGGFSDRESGHQLFASCLCGIEFFFVS